VNSSDDSAGDNVSECPACSGRETCTGKSEVREGKLWFEMRCEDCGSTGWEWHAGWKAHLGSRRESGIDDGPDPVKNEARREAEGDDPGAAS
jgi:hypothetical protein